MALSASRGEIEFDQAVSSTNATGEDFEKLSNELALGRESLGRSVATDAFVWLYRDVGFARRWSAELGLGAGGSRRTLHIGWNWTRSANPEDIATGGDQPNADEIRANLAGTRSVGEARIQDDLYAVGLSVGVAKRLRDGIDIGLKAQWRYYAELVSEPYAGTLLRNHAPNLRLDGSEPVTAWSRTKNTDALATTLFVRYSV